MSSELSESNDCKTQNNNVIPKKMEAKPKVDCELIFSKFDQLDFGTRSRKNSIFSRRPTMKLDFAESLQLYKLVGIDVDNDTFENEEDVHIGRTQSCSCNGFNSLHSSYSSDSTGTSNSTKSEVIALSTEFFNCKSLSNVKSSSCKTYEKSSKNNLTEKQVENSSIFSFFDNSPSTPRTPTISSSLSCLSSSVQRSLSFQSPETTTRRRRFSLFGHRHSDAMSTSLSSLSSLHSSPAISSDVKTPSPERFETMYHVVRKGVSEHISVNTAELNVLRVRQREADKLNAAHSYEIEKLAKHLERVIKKLQYQQTQLDEIHEAYVLQQRYRDGAAKLKSALSSSRVSSRSSRLELKADLTRSTETLCSLEQELVGFFGIFRFDMKGLLGFAKLRSGDQYEVVLRHGAQKWRMRGAVKTMGDQTWENKQTSMHPMLCDRINVKVHELKILGKHVTVGNVVCETKDLFKVESQDLTIELNDTATLKLNLNVQWSPFDGYETPLRTQNVATSWTSDYIRSRAKSVAERPNFSSPRLKLGNALSRPISGSYSSSLNNSNNCNNKSVISISAPLISTKSRCLIESSMPGSRPEVPFQKTVLSEEEAFMKVTTDRQRSLHSNSSPSETDMKFPIKNSPKQISISRRLVRAVTQLNFDLDDVRGRYVELKAVESIVQMLLKHLKANEKDSIVTDGFSVLSSDDDEAREDKSRFEKNPLPTIGSTTCDEAMTAHLCFCQVLLKDIGVFGPLKVRETIAFDKLQKQGEILRRIYELATSEKKLTFDEMKEFEKRRTLLEIWRSCCDGNTSLCVSAKTFRLELIAGFGREVRAKHPEVASEVFPELVRRVLDRRDVLDVDAQVVTLFHVSSYVDSTIDGEEDFGKLIGKLAGEMFITSALSSGINSLVLVAIKRLSSLLALRTSNLRALSHLLLSNHQQVRSASAAHIRHISSNSDLRKKAIVSYAELLESSSKKDRECACIALGFLGATETTPQLAYIRHSDVEVDVREAASKVLVSMGTEGTEALEQASSTFLVQTDSQQLHDTTTHLGTAL